MILVLFQFLVFISTQESSPADATDKGKLTFDDIHGLWIAKSVTVDGEQVPRKAAQELRWTFKSRQLLVVQQLNNDPAEECVLRFDPDSSPVSFQFDVPAKRIRKPPAGSDAENINPIVIGIMKREGDKLIVSICRRTRTPVRPSSFESKPGSDTIVIQFARPPKPEKPPADEERKTE